MYESGPVLLGDLCAVLRLGLRSVLLECGYDVIGDGVPASSTLAPQAVLLDLDAPGFFRVAEAIVAERPDTPVIGCSADDSEMCVVTRAGRGERVPLELPALLAAIRV